MALSRLFKVQSEMVVTDLALKAYDNVRTSSAGPRIARLMFEDQIKARIRHWLRSSAANDYRDILNQLWLPPNDRS